MSINKVGEDLEAEEGQREGQREGGNSSEAVGIAVSTAILTTAAVAVVVAVGVALCWGITHGYMYVTDSHEIELVTQLIVTDLLVSRTRGLGMIIILLL